MEKMFKVRVFGKAGCDKCVTLNRRLDKMFALEEWGDFEKHYCDVGTEDGLLHFCRAQCVNPSRIPAFMVTKRCEKTGVYQPIENPTPGETDKVCGNSPLYQYVGLQTDYSELGKGLLKPKMIAATLERAQTL